MIKNILIDLDDTVLDFKRAESVALTRTLSECGIQPTADRIALYSMINSARWELLEEGKITRPEVLTSRFRLLFEVLGLPDWERAPKLYEAYLSVGHWFCPGAEEMLKTLSGRYRLFLASNGVRRIQKGRIASAGIAPYFEKMFVSEDLGADKPSALFFEKAFAQIPDFRREETVIVGDSLTSDIRGGNNAGIRTVWYNPKGKENVLGVRVDVEYRDHADLPAILAKM